MVAVTNTYDLADELTSSLNKVGSNPAQTTSYSYDGNGNQVLASGPGGVTTNTYNQQNELVQVVGPTNDLSLVYDGQGERLRSYEQAVPSPVIVNDTQDLVGGLSSLASDGTQDYLYLQPGSGQAPVAGYNPSTSGATYLAVDDLGSVRLATGPTGAVVGAGAYDAWGTAQPNLGGSGATLLAALQASSPFGYAGQEYDAGPGTYAMRARTYNPATGRFESEDPQAYSPNLPITLNPYAYAWDQPDERTDPSGASPDTNTGFIDTLVLNDIASRLPPSPAPSPTPQPGWYRQVKVITSTACRHVTSSQYANLVDILTNNPVTGYIYDIEAAEAVHGPGNLLLQEQVWNLAIAMELHGFIIPGQDAIQKGTFSPGITDPGAAVPTPAVLPAPEEPGTLPVIGDVHQLLPVPVPTEADVPSGTTLGLTYWLTGNNTVVGNGLIVYVAILNPIVGDNPKGVSGHTTAIQDAIRDALRPDEIVAFRSRPVDASAFDGLISQKPQGADTIEEDPNGNPYPNLYGIRKVQLKDNAGTQWIVSDLDAGWALSGCDPVTGLHCQKLIQDKDFVNGIEDQINQNYGVPIVQHGPVVNFIYDNCTFWTSVDACSDRIIGLLTSTVWVYSKSDPEGSIASGQMLIMLSSFLDHDQDTHPDNYKVITALYDLLNPVRPVAMPLPTA
jgi:RHS repeat-associated protein